MIRKTTKIAIEVVIGVLAGLALLSGLALWRLSTAPVEIDFLTPYLEAAFEKSDSKFRVDIGQTVLTWEGWSRTIDLRTRQITLRDRSDTILASLPDASISLSLRALVQGTVAPTVIEVVGAQVNVTRRVDGTFEFGARAVPAEAVAAEPVANNDFSSLFPVIIDRLRSEPDPNQPLAFLEAVRITGGQVSVNDKKLSLSWNAPTADIEIRRDEAGLAGELALVVALGETRTKFDAAFVYDKQSDLIDLAATFSDLSPAALASLVPRIEPLAGLNAPLNGSLSASLAVDGTIADLRFDIEGGAGSISIAEIIPEPLPLQSLSLRGNLDRRARKLSLEKAMLRFGAPDAPGPTLSLVGSITSSTGDLDGDLAVEAEVQAVDVQADLLHEYWPHGISGNARSWVLENAKTGIVDQAVLRLGLRVPGGNFDATRIAGFGGTLRYHDLDIHFLRPIPPITGVFGTAAFDSKSITFDAKGGQLNSLQLQESKIAITGLDEFDQPMDIDVAIVGPVREALEILDHERLGLISRLGIDPAETDGQAAARLGFKFPLLADLTFDDMEITANANLSQVGVKQILLGQDVTEGDVSLELTKSAMKIAGPVKLGGVPMDISWDEAFTEDVVDRTRLNALIPRFDDDKRQAFGLDVVPGLEGPISASVVVAMRRDSTATVKSAINLREARLVIDPLAWEKEPGIDGEARLTIDMLGQRLVGLSSLNLRSGSLSAQGSARFSENGKSLESLSLAELQFSGSTLNDVDVTWLDDGVHVALGGGVLDAAPFMEDDESADGDQPPQEREPFSLSAPQLKAVYFGSGRFLETVTLALSRSRQGWEQITVVGGVPRALWDPDKEAKTENGAALAKRTLSVDYRPVAEGGQQLNVATNDMGAVLRALNILDTVRGGTLEITGSSEGPTPKYPISAHVEAEDYVVVNAPLLAKLLSVASLTGGAELLDGEGLQFSRLTGDVTIQNGVIETDLIRAYGSAMGLTAKGKIDLDESIIDLKGTIVPAYTVNRVLGSIPVLGRLLTGGEGEGIFAVIYTMKGDLDKPEIFVNPLAALTPGFLRGLFGIFDGEGKPVEPRAIPPEPGR